MIAEIHLKARGNGAMTYQNSSGKLKKIYRMKLKSIELQNIKSFVHLKIDDLDKKDLVIFVGENGSGKSTIFDVLNMVFPLIANNDQNVYRSNDLLKNSQATGSVKIEFVFSEGEVSDSSLTTDSVGFLEFSLTRGAGISMTGNQFLAEMKKLFLDRYGNFDEAHIQNFGTYIHKSPYRYEEVSDINEPQRNLLDPEQDKKDINKKAQISSSKWQVVLSYLLQLERRMKAKYFEVNSQNVSTAIGELQKIEQDRQNIIQDFNQLLEGKEFLEIEETGDGKTFFWMTKGNDEKIEFKQLSSGEKEALFLFADIRRQKPNHSIIAVDEPELHLHYNLQRKLVERFLDIGLNNQIFLTTHSLGVIKGANNQSDRTAIYHFNGNESSPCMKVETKENFLELYKVLADDLAGILTNEAVIFVEGEDRERDAKFFTQMFSEYTTLNFIPCGNRDHVGAAAWLALTLVSEQTTPQKLFAITDGDGRNSQEKKDREKQLENLLVLDRYSLENYFFDFSIWEKIDSQYKNASFVEFNEQQFLDHVKNILTDESKCSLAISKIQGSRRRLRLDERTPQEIRSLLDASLVDGTFVEVFPMKEFLPQIRAEVFNFDSNDAFCIEFIDVMKREMAIPIIVRDFISRIVNPVSPSPPFP